MDSSTGLHSIHMTLKSQHSTFSQGFFLLSGSAGISPYVERKWKLGFVSNHHWKPLHSEVSGVIWLVGLVTVGEKLLLEKVGHWAYHFPVCFLYSVKAFFVRVKSSVIPVTFTRLLK